MIIEQNELNEDVKNGKIPYIVYKFKKGDLSECTRMLDIYKTIGVDWQSINKKLGRKIDIPTEFYASRETNEFLRETLVKNAKKDKYYKIFKPLYRESLVNLDWANISPKDADVSEEIKFGLILFLVNNDKKLWNEAHKDPKVKMTYFGEEL